MKQLSSTALNKKTCKSEEQLYKKCLHCKMKIQSVLYMATCVFMDLDHLYHYVTKEIVRNVVKSKEFI